MIATSRWQNYLTVDGERTEHAEQAALFDWIVEQSERYPALQNAFAVPNGGFRHKATARFLREEGLMPGVPDVILLAPSKKHHGLCIEMKRANGKASDVKEHQWEWFQRLERSGYMTVVAYGCAEAIKAICDYLGIKDPTE